MKKFIMGLLLGEFLALAIVFFTTVKEPTDTILPQKEKQLSDWDILTLALAKTESDYKPTAKGPTGDYGILQITQVYVDDINRILKEDKYTLEDAYSPIKSIEMFNIYQSYYNPDKDIDKAIHLHNPGAGDWYSNRVIKNMEYVRNYEHVRKALETSI